MLKSNDQLGRGGGQVVRGLAFHSDDLSSNPAEAYSLIYNFCVWKIQKQKRPWLAHFKKS